LEQLQPPKRRKVRQDPNERFMSLAEVALQGNQTPVQHIAREGSCIVVAEEEEEESEEEPLRRQSARVKRPSQRYLDRDLDSEDDDE
jgi:microcystin degradation protein MlrC